VTIAVVTDNMKPTEIFASDEHQPLGDQQLEVLRYVSDNAPITVGEMAKAFGAPRGLARTTILTVMERLRTKGYLTRRKVEGVFQYSPRLEQQDLLKGLVGEFVQRSLGGSLAPFVTYLADSGRLSAREVAELRRMAESLEAQEVKGA
jgi:predicted transcriptional regulator